MSPELKAIADNITDLWQEVEAKTQGPELKDDNCPLTIERYATRMRLCYKGKAISEWNMDNKIEAASYLGQFRELINNRLNERFIKARNAEHLLTEFLNELHSAIQTGSGRNNQE